MTRRNIPLGRILGIPIGLDYSWFVIFALLTWMLAGNYYPAEFKHWSQSMYWAMGAVTAIMLFVSVLLHELGHSVAALRYKIPVKNITLFLFGGIAQLGDEPPSAVAEFVIAIAGPIVSLIVSFFFYLVEPLASHVEPLIGLFKYLAYINFALVLFNLIPGYPLDGGRVFRAMVWAFTGNLRRATFIAVNVGRFFALLFIIVGVWQMISGNFGGGLWIALIGWFLDKTAIAQIQQDPFHGVLAGHKVSQVMNAHGAVVPVDYTLQQLEDDHILDNAQRSFLVNHFRDTVGLVTKNRIQEVPRSEWTTTSAAQVMIPFEHVKSIDPNADLWDALQKMDRNGFNQLPVTKDRHVIGMVSREDVITFIHTLQESGS